MNGNPRPDAGSKRRSYSARGFTLLELMIVMAIVVVLVAMSAGRFEKSVLRAHESALRQDLSVMRQAIQNYTLDKEAAPSSLDDLHTAGYIGDVPTDPITHQKDWVTETCTDVLSPDQVPGGICNVHSSSDATSSDGTTYSQY
jgi:general secretion pathway protein G